ncbi:hypothetical protein [Niveibacterium terrae]|uniref:hypothetical protein n=1 Tax=Niveibacterium terrae TaxID=3373598 RepID=UPI003A92C78A
MNDREIIRIMGWANKDGHSEMDLRRARDLVEAARRERENEIRETAWLDGRDAFEWEMKRRGYDTKTTSAGVYRWPEVRAMWNGWELMRTRAAAQGLFGGKEAA